MSTPVKDILTKKYPASIKNHKAFKSLKTISKIFPDIGLPNCQEEMSIDNSKEKRDAAQALLKAIKDTLDHRYKKLGDWEKKKEKKFAADRKAKFENCRAILNSLRSDLSKRQKDFFVENNGKLTLNLPQEIKDASDKAVFKSQERLFGVYGKINEALKDGKFCQMDKIEMLPQFKDFSSKNMSSNKLLIRFSSDGAEGVWDVATMSMRGISSCQSWGSGNATHVVGSMIDPFTGIIYITTGDDKFSEYGSKMIRRCIVRFIVNEKTKKSYLFLERMYPAHDEPTLKAFRDFLTKRTDGKFEIKSSGDSITGAYVPMSSAVRNLAATDQPYRDSGIQYKNDQHDKQARFKEIIDAKMLRIYSVITNSFRTATNGIKAKDVSKNSAQAFRAMKGDNYYYDYSYYYYDSIVTMVKGFLTKIDHKAYKDPDSLVKDATEKLSASKLNSKIATAIKATIKSNNIPAGYKKLDGKLIKSISDSAAQHMAQALKGEIERVTAQIKPVAEAENIPEDVPVYVKHLN
jgi:hypothetical protein